MRDPVDPVPPPTSYSPRDAEIPVYIDRKVQTMKLADWLDYVRYRMRNCGKYVVLTVADINSSFGFTYARQDMSQVFKAFPVGCGKRFACPSCAHRFFVKIYNELYDLIERYDPCLIHDELGSPSSYILYVDLTPPPHYHVRTGLKAREILRQFNRDFDKLMNMRLSTVLEIAKHLYSVILGMPSKLTYRQRRTQWKYLSIFISYCEQLIASSPPDKRLTFRDLFPIVYRFTEPAGDKFWKTGYFHPHHNLIVISDVPIPQVLLSELWRRINGAPVTYVKPERNISRLAKYLTKYLTKSLPNADSDPKLVEELIIATYRIRMFSRSRFAVPKTLIRYYPIGFARLDHPIYSVTDKVIGELIAVKSDNGEPCFYPSGDILFPSVEIVKSWSGAYTWRLVITRDGKNYEPIIFSLASLRGDEWLGVVTAWHTGLSPPDPSYEYEDSYIDEYLDF